MNLSPKFKYSWAWARLEPETQSPSPTQARKIWAHSSSSRLSLLRPTDVSINGRKWIIQEVDVPVAVDRPGQAHPLLLASRQVDSLLSDLSHVGLGQDGQVRPQGTSIQYLHDLKVWLFFLHRGSLDIFLYCFEPPTDLANDRLWRAGIVDPSLVLLHPLIIVTIADPMTASLRRASLVKGLLANCQL